MPRKPEAGATPHPKASKVGRPQKPGRAAKAARKAAGVKEGNPELIRPEVTLGRPTIYTRAASDEICARMAGGETLNQICRDDHMPARPTVMRWTAEDRDDFSDRYNEARARLLEHWSDETIDISDDGRNDWMERATKDGDPVVTVNGDHIQRSKLRVETRKWLLSKLNPAVYGDRQRIDHTAGGALGQLLDELSGTTASLV